MKRYLIQLIGVILAAVLCMMLVVSCGNKKGDPSTVSGTEEVTAGPADETTTKAEEKTRPKPPVVTNAPADDQTTEPVTDEPLPVINGAVGVGTDAGTWNDPVDMH